MSTVKDYNDNLKELEQTRQLISMLSEKQYGLVLRSLWRRNDILVNILDKATSPPRRTLAEILATAKAKLAERQNRS